MLTEVLQLVLAVCEHDARALLRFTSCCDCACRPITIGARAWVGKTELLTEKTKQIRPFRKTNKTTCFGLCIRARPCICQPRHALRAPIRRLHPYHRVTAGICVDSTNNEDHLQIKQYTIRKLCIYYTTVLYSVTLSAL